MKYFFLSIGAFHYATISHIYLRIAIVDRYAIKPILLHFLKMIYKSILILLFLVSSIC